MGFNYADIFKAFMCLHHIRQCRTGAIIPTQTVAEADYENHMMTSRVLSITSDFLYYFTIRRHNLYA